MSAETLFHDFISIQSRGVLALPAELRKRYGLDRPGAQMEITERQDGVLEFRPQLPVPASQAWFWTDEWQQREREVDADIAAGQTTTYASSEDFLAALEAE